MVAQDEVRILVVDDEENISFLLSAAMKNQGYEVQTCGDGQSAVAKARSFNPHLIILDVMLPDGNGIEVLRLIRNHGVTAPIIFLSALGETTDRVSGLAAGGEDYIVKPFALEELIARVQVQLRRHGSLQKSVILEVGNLVLDVEARRVWRNQIESHLSSTEFNLLHYLMSNSGKVVTRSQILNHVWQYDFDGDSAIIEAVISNVRKKIDHGTIRLIHTIRGIGYSIREPE